ncbi:hypothetical protein EVAR_79859_1 [Eumeta japonica]|uniref:Uncharacterized protein n=1 Tax=Eumeta variegata TaxID=151549 RepID=A0A4C1TYX6_EUMVA|nr:hypothetical protein EVAR_79859_1 [Eumeta japonica]
MYYCAKLNAVLIGFHPTAIERVQSGQLTYTSTDWQSSFLRRYMQETEHGIPCERENLPHAAEEDADKPPKGRKRQPAACKLASSPAAALPHTTSYYLING